jgi:hypothetical protein
MSVAAMPERKNFYLSPEAIRRLRMESAVTNRPMSTIVNQLLVKHLPDRSIHSGKA